MPAATKDIHDANTRLPKIQTAYRRTAGGHSSSPMTAHRRPATPLGASRELPMPVISRISSLDQAEATLQHCAIRLSKSWQNNPARASPPSSPIDGNERRHFQQWLGQWEQAFTAYLSVSMAGMKSDDITRCRVLKANQLSCTILASDAGPNARSSSMYESECRAIVELANVIVSSRPPLGGSSSLKTATARDSMPRCLDVREPLYVVVARCDRDLVRTQAAEILQRMGSR